MSLSRQRVCVRVCDVITLVIILVGPDQTIKRIYIYIERYVAAPVIR